MSKDKQTISAELVEKESLKLLLEQRENELLDANIELSKLRETFKKSEILLQSSLESFSDIIILSVDLNYCYLYFNEVHKNTMKQLYNVDIKLGTKLLDYITDENDKMDSKRNFDRALSGKYHTTIEDIKGLDRIINFEATYNPIYDNDGNIIGVSLFARDITEKQKIQAVTIESLDRLNRSEKISKVGSWELDLKTNLIWASEEAFNIYEITRDSEYLDLVTIRGMVSKEDKKLLEHSLQQLIEHDDPYDIYFELDTGNHIKYIRSKASISKNAQGKPTKVLGVIRDITELKQKEDELIYLSYHDKLTGIYNRRFLFDTIDKLWRENIRQKQPISFVMIDIDNFKQYNDCFGHIKGDEALRSVANALMTSLTRPLDMVGRYGGEEFLIVLPNTILDGAYKVAEKLRKNILNLGITHGDIYNNKFLTISLGVTSVIPKQKITIEEIINQADIAMFSAKEKGKNKTETYKI